nr:hypothetical protein [Tanacetum cinerariifolium]
MHNNIMAAGSRDRPPMLAPGQYPQWRSRFLRYVDTRPNGEALRKCILSDPYKPTTVLVQAVEATDDSPTVPEHTTVRDTPRIEGIHRILMISSRLIPLSEHNVDFHPIVDFVEASPLRIETTEKETKILATVDGILRTITESSLRRNLKLKDEEGIKSVFPSVEVSHTIMQCLSPKRIGFNEFSRNITTSLGFTDLCTSLQRQQSDLVSKFEAQEVEITMLKSRVKLLEDGEGRGAERSGDDAPIKGRRLDEGEEVAEKGSNDTEEMINVLTSMDAATVLSSRVTEVPTGSGSIPPAGPLAAKVPIGSDVVPTAGPIFSTATMVTPYTRRKGKEKMIESETPKKKNIQEQMDIQMAKQMEEEMEREAQRMNEQIAKDVEIARIHAEEELQIMIDGLDRSNETVAKYLQEYHQFAIELPIERRIELIIIKGHVGWKTKDFKGISFEQIEAKFNTVWKHIEDFIPIGSKEETERFKRKGLRLEQVSEKKLKTSEEVPEEVKATEEVPKHKVHTEGQRNYWKIIRLGGSSARYQFFVDLLKHLDKEDLNQLWALVKESLNIKTASSDKEMELWVELKRLYEPDVEDQLWTHTQNMIHALVEWKLYDSCGVHHVTSKDNEIFMLIEKDYPLRKGLVIVMISYKLQVENYSQMASDLILKIYKIANRPRQEDD